MIRVGLVGLGPMGILHTGIIQSLPDRKVIAISDVDPRMTGPASGLVPDIKFFSDYSAMLKETALDAIYVCTPVPTHAKIVEGVIREGQGAAVFVEKPLASSSSEANALAQLAKSSGLISAVGFQRRFVPSFRFAHDLIQRGVPGEIKLFRAVHLASGVLEAGSGWRFSKGSGGVLLEFAPHILDTVCYLLGTPRVTTASTSSFFSTEVEDYAHAVLETSHGVRGTLDVSWSFRNYQPGDFSVEIHGSNGTLSVTMERVIVYLDESVDPDLPAGITSWDGARLAHPVPIFLGGYENVAIDDYFLRCVEQHIETEISFAQGAIVNRLIEEIRSQAGSVSAKGH